MSPQVLNTITLVYGRIPMCDLFEVRMYIKDESVRIYTADSSEQVAHWAKMFRGQLSAQLCAVEVIAIEKITTPSPVGPQPLLPCME